MRIIAYKTSTISNKTMLEESTGYHTLSSDPEALFSFLCEPYEDTIRVTWNLNGFASLLLKYLPIKQLEKIRNTNKGYFPPFNIFYIPGKIFSVSHIPSKIRVNFYDLEQYYPNLDEPDSLADLQTLGEYLMRELKKMHLEPTRLTSPIAIYDECIMSNLDLPEAKDMPLEACEFAYRCATRHWIEAHQIGYFPLTYDYDMISAFPTVMKQLIDFRSCKWVHSSNYQPDAIYGYTYSDIHINPETKLHPILHETADYLQSSTGNFSDYIDKNKLDFITKYNLGHYTIHDGYWAIPPKKAKLKYPFYAPITSLLKHKDITPLQTLLAKRMSTGVWGKLGEELKDSFGKHFNPCWFAEVSSRVSLLVAEFLYTHNFHTENYPHLLHISLDGFKTTTPVKLPLKSDKWRLAYQGASLIISSGLCYTNNTKPRGLTLSDTLSLIKKQPGISYYSKKLTRLATLNDSITANKPYLLGTPVTLLSSIDLSHPDHDRFFPSLPKTGRDLLTNVYTSEPIKLAKE